MKVADAVRGVPRGSEISVFCQPRAARQGCVGMHAGALKVKVRAAALEGRANEALLDLLAGALGVERHRLMVVSGRQSRLKRVRVDRAGPAEVTARLEAALRETAGGAGRVD